MFGSGQMVDKVTWVFFLCQYSIDMWIETTIHRV